MVSDQLRPCDGLVCYVGADSVFATSGVDSGGALDGGTRTGGAALLISQMSQDLVDNFGAAFSSTPGSVGGIPRPAGSRSPGKRDYF